MTIRVVAAFFDSGFLKAGMPLEIASTPVSAVQPEVKARRMRKRPIPSVACSASRGVDVAAGSPVSTRTKPMAIITNMPTTKT